MVHKDLRDFLFDFYKSTESDAQKDFRIKSDERISNNIRSVWIYLKVILKEKLYLGILFRFGLIKNISQDEVEFLKDFLIKINEPLPVDPPKSKLQMIILSLRSSIYFSEDFIDEDCESLRHLIYDYVNKEHCSIETASDEILRWIYERKSAYNNFI